MPTRGNVLSSRMTENTASFRNIDFSDEALLSTRVSRPPAVSRPQSHTVWRLAMEPSVNEDAVALSAQMALSHMTNLNLRSKTNPLTAPNGPPQNVVSEGYSLSLLVNNYFREQNA